MTNFPNPELQNLDAVAVRELQGRCILWLTALHQCEEVLRMAIRSLAWAIDEGAKPYVDDDGYAAWRRQQPDFHESEVFESGAHRAYRLRHADDFPDVTEGFSLANYLPILACVMFVTVFNKGHADPGSVAKNVAPLTIALRNSIVQHAFPDAKKRTEFEELLDRITLARNSLITHVDGIAYNVERDPAMIKTKTFLSAFQRDDTELLFGACGALLGSLKAHLSLLK
jgi:hypothetical protein